MTLRDQQQAMLAVLLDWPSEQAVNNIAPYQAHTWTRGLQAYQSNAHALAERTLQAAFPVLTQLLGEDSFGRLSRAFWHAHPPQCGDMAQWGDGLPAFVRASAQLADEPFLADVAGVEWWLHCCASASDQDVDAASFALLSSQDAAQLCLQLAPGCATLVSDWPVVSLVCAHLEQHPSLQEVGRLVRQQQAETAVIWRQGLRPRVRLAWPGETTLLQALLQGSSLADAMSQADTLDLSAWLPMAVQSGLVLAVQHRASLRF